MISTSLKAFVSSDISAKSEQHSTRRIKAPRGTNRSNKSHVESYFEFLDSFSSKNDQLQCAAQAIKTNIAGYSRSIRDDEIPDDIPIHVHKTLHGVLKKYSRCCCIPSTANTGSLRQHEGRLKLKESIQTTDGNFTFNAVFSRRPHNDSADGIEWRHIQFNIPG